MIFKESRSKKNFFKIHDKTVTRKKIYSNKIYKKDVGFGLVCNTTKRFRQALNGESKSISTKEILGIDSDTYRKRIEYQFTPEANWSNIQIDHVKRNCWIHRCNIGLKEAFCWKNTQPFFKQDQQHKGSNFNFLEC